MLTRHSPPTLLLPLLGVLACNPATDPNLDTDPNPDTDPSPDTDPVVQSPCPPERATPTSELCPPTRQIAHLPDAEGCPPAPGWVVDELFTGESTPKAMHNYCRYLWAGEGKPTPLPPAIAAKASSDCRMFVQSPLAAELGPSYQQAFLAGVQALPDPSVLGPGFPVDIAVIDTAPADTVAGQADHGPAIAAIVAAVASGCMRQSGSCQRSVATVLGLPQVVGQGANPQQGGYFGYQSDLAQGIFAAIEGWTNRDHRMILNLSVGWEPNVGQASAAIAAVEHALQLARCQGALVVAASGNQPPSSCVEQPTGPGAWASQSALTIRECQALMPESPAIAPQAGTQQPLVYAATPLDWQDRNLLDFRPGSNASLATLGFAAYVEVADPSGRSTIAYGPLSGSSVATATVCGIAALVWSNFPKLTADEVMDILHDSGTPRTLDGQPVLADFALTGKTEQRVVTACGALIHACDVQPTSHLISDAQCAAAKRSCEASYRDDAVAREKTWWAAFEQALDALPANQSITRAAPALLGQDCQHCSAAESTWQPRSTALAASAMPDPWVLPQPEKPPCPLCQIKDDDIYLGLDPDYAGYNVANVSVTIADATGTSEVRNYGPLALTSTTLTVLEDKELRHVGSGTTGPAPIKAKVTMVFTIAATNERLTASNQIPVGP